MIEYLLPCRLKIGIHLNLGENQQTYVCTAGQCQAKLVLAHSDSISFNVSIILGWEKFGTQSIPM